MNRRKFVQLLSLAAAAPWLSGPRAAAPWDDETWFDASRDRQLPVRIRWPQGDEACAVVFFSHGLGGSRSGAAVWGQAWAAAGLAVVHLQHPGSDVEIWRGGMGSIRQGAQLEQYLQRIRDAHFAIDELARRKTLGGVWARVRLDAIGFSGHSFGARLTQAVAGERPTRAGADALASMHDERPRAFIAFSPGFNAREGNADAQAGARFNAITRPFLCVTGTRDEAMIVGDATNAARRAVYRALPTGRKAELLLAGADHMTFAGQPVASSETVPVARVLRTALAREPGAAELQSRHHERVAQITADWWRWRLLGDEAAQRRLVSPVGLGPEDRWQQG